MVVALFSPALELETFVRSRLHTVSCLILTQVPPISTHVSFMGSVSGLWVAFCCPFGNIIEKIWLFSEFIFPSWQVLKKKTPEAVKELIFLQGSRCPQHLDFGNILRTVSLSNESERYALCLTGRLSPPPKKRCCWTASRHVRQGEICFCSGLPLSSTFSSNCCWYPSS